jgi:hypothetical protein
MCESPANHVHNVQKIKEKLTRLYSLVREWFKEVQELNRKLATFSKLKEICERPSSTVTNKDSLCYESSMDKFTSNLPEW